MKTLKSKGFINFVETFTIIISALSVCNQNITFWLHIIYTQLNFDRFDPETLIIGITNKAHLE